MDKKDIDYILSINLDLIKNKMLSNDDSVLLLQKSLTDKISELIKEKEMNSKLNADLLIISKDDH
jgi:hypothetical protein